MPRSCRKARARVGPIPPNGIPALVEAELVGDDDGIGMVVAERPTSVGQAVLVQLPGRLGLTH
jgi:hypothetical protein